MIVLKSFIKISSDIYLELYEEKELAFISSDYGHKIKHEELAINTFSIFSNRRVSFSS